MVKQKTVTSSQTNPKRPKQLKKTASFKKSLENEMKRLRKLQPSLSTRDFAIKMHNFIKEYQAKVQPLRDLTAEAISTVRICKQCNLWTKRDKFVECYQCQDSYHVGCAENLERLDDDQWLCQSCEKVCDERETRQKMLEQFGITKKPVKFCNRCNEEANKGSIRCIRCKCNYHQECFDFGSTTIVCRNCHKEIQGQIQKRKSSGRQTTLLAFFDKQQFYSRQPTNAQTEQQLSVTASWAQHLLLKPPVFLTEQEIKQYKQNLLYAIYSKQMQYTEELEWKCQQPENIEELDVTLDRINEKDLQAYVKYKKQPIGPYEIKAVKGMGYDVLSRKAIPRGTIICEYIGQVITKREAIKHIENDSLMELLTGRNADISLIIKPEEFCNIARFINGINNNREDSYKKVNVSTVRLNILGVPRVILYAKRSIKAGQSLQYDYNAALNMYPTDDFI